MERGNTKHGPRLDEQMAAEVRAQTQGAGAGARAQEWHEPEPAGEDQPAPTLVPGGVRPGGAPAPMTADEVEARSQLGRHLPRSALPADRAALVRAATESQAPDQVLAQLHALPPDREFATIAEIWAALGHPNEERT